MRDWLSLAVLVLLVLGAASVVIAASCAAIAGARWLRGRTAPAPAPRLAYVPQQRRVVWTACHTTQCGHMHTPHYPAGPGLVMCHHCKTQRPDPS
ncbi:MULTISPECIES: hypothetical protein [unclassified Streptomyces]|uniref:hypothetical protein n=1 Tax=unclassified Streptomyces TaxID=2593676 RepID=UPI0036EC600C